MTIQNWSLHPRRASIICDSLASDVTTHQPLSFMAKAWCLPERSIMVAAKDWAHPALQFYIRCLVGQAPIGLHDIVEYAGSVMRMTASEMPECLEALPSTRAILFGWDPEANQIRGWLFHAGQSFQPTPMPVGHLLAPTLAPAPLDHEPCWSAIAGMQQKGDRKSPPADRDNIGGWLLQYQMEVQPDGSPPLITMRNLGEMPHFADDAAHIFTSNNLIRNINDL